MSSLLRSDAAKISRNLSLVAKDAKHGQNGGGEPPCYNLQNNVTPDAHAIGTFVNSDVDNDVNNLNTDISTLEADIGSFHQDIADFVNDGVPTPAGAKKAVERIRAKIAAEIASAKRLIAVMQTNVDAAYAYGNNMAHGACSGDGPGPAPGLAPVTS